MDGVQEWGAVEGDINADAIIHDFNREWRVSKAFVLCILAIFLATAWWFAVSESSLALALLIVAAVFLIISSVLLKLYAAHMLLLVAERRIQLVEQKLQRLAMNERG